MAPLAGKELALLRLSKAMLYGSPVPNLSQQAIVSQNLLSVQPLTFVCYRALS